MNRSNQRFMRKANGKSQAEMQGLDLEHELPAADGDERASATARQPKEKHLAPNQSCRSSRRSATHCWTAWLARRQSSKTPASAPRRTAGLSRLCHGRRDQIVAAGHSTASSAHCRSSRSAGRFRSGVELIYKQLQDALAKLGVQPIPAKGEPSIRMCMRRSRWWRPPTRPTMR